MTRQLVLDWMRVRTHKRLPPLTLSDDLFSQKPRSKQQQILPLFHDSSSSSSSSRARKGEETQNQASDPLLALVSRRHYCPPNLTPPYPRLAIIFYHCVHASSTPRLPIPLRFHAKDFSFLIILYIHGL